MTRALALLRPEPGWSATAKTARDLGLEVVGHPLFATEGVAWSMPAEPIDALLIGSGAVFRHAGPQLAALSHLPVDCVGEATALAARAAGFQVEHVGAEGLQAALAGSPRRSGLFLRLGGEERVKLTPLAGQHIVERTVYRLRPLAIAPDFASQLRKARPVVALHSAAAARWFGSELERLTIARAHLRVVALGPRIARSAGGGWAALHIAERATDASLLAKAAALCKD